MTEFVFHQLKKLADNPDHFLDCLEYWGEDPNKEPEAIRKLISPYFLKGKLLDTKLRRMTIGNDTVSVFFFKTENDQSEYVMMGVIGDDNTPHIVILKNNFNPQLN